MKVSVNEFKEALESYIGGSSGRTLNAIASRAGFSSSSNLWKTLKDESRKWVSMEIVIKTLSAIHPSMSKEEIAQHYLEKDYPLGKSLMGYLEEYHPLKDDQKTKLLTDDEIADYFSDSRYQRIILNAHTTKGVTRDHIKEYYGKTGLIAFNELTEKGVLVSTKSGVYRLNCSDDKKLSFSPQTDKRNASSAIRNLFKDAYAGTGTNFRSWFSNSYTWDEYQSMRKTLIQCHKQVSEIANKSEGNGNFTFFLTMFADSVEPLVNENTINNDDGVLQ